MKAASLQRQNAVGQNLGIGALAKFPRVKPLEALTHDAKTEVNEEAL